MQSRLCAALLALSAVAAAAEATFVCPNTSFTLNITTTVPGYTYNNCDTITNIVFDTTGAVTAIGDHAFNNVDNISNVTFPTSVISIGTAAFSDCNSLAKVIFDAPGQLSSIGEGAFRGLPLLEVFEILESVTTIGSDILKNCPILNRVIVNGTSPWDDDTSLTNLVNTLCDNSTGPACIEGNGARAADIVFHPNNTCNLDGCGVLPSCSTPPPSGNFEFLPSTF